MNSLGYKCFILLLNSTCNIIFHPPADVHPSVFPSLLSFSSSDGKLNDCLKAPVIMTTTTLVAVIYGYRMHL